MKDFKCFLSGSPGGSVVKVCVSETKREDVSKTMKGRLIILKKTDFFSGS